MARLPPNYQGKPSQSDIIQLLHDEVVSLCQKNYSAASALEIDGIICISILDTKEQQVVKIHKTLKSVFGKTYKRQKREEKLHSQPSYWLHGNTGDSGLPTENKAHGPENYQDDINTLSDLLRDTNAAINRGNTVISQDEPVSKKNRRKRKSPKQRIVINSATQQPANTTENTKTEEVSNSINSPLNFSNLPDGFQDSPGINPFIHKDILKVKEEKIDPEYGEAEKLQPKIVSVSSVIDSDKGSNETGSDGVEKTKVLSLIENIIDRAIPSESTSQERSDRIGENNPNAYQDSRTTEDADKPFEGESEYQAIEVKVEKTTDESEYGGSQECDQGDFSEFESENWGMGENISDSNWLYNSAFSSSNEIGKTALLNKFHDKGRLAHIGYPPSYVQERGRQEPDPQGRSWIDMVKDNVNKYQAALERSASKGRKEAGNDPTVNTSSSSTPSSLVTKSSSLVALLKQPAVLPKSKDVPIELNKVSARNARGSSVPAQGTDVINDRSTSLSPVVKIEVDEELSHDMYSQSDSEVNGDVAGREKASASSKPQGVVGHVAKAPQGKLESRYPALFSHLQHAKQAGNDGGGQESTDSLVNRLPFISFQELFSHAATGSTAPRMSESTTMQLLAQARINPYPSKDKPKTLQRKVWNWKKRQVRPKDAYGKIISPIPVSYMAHASKKSQGSEKKRRWLGIHMSPRNTVSKKIQKSEQEIDQDWQPGVEAEVDSDAAESVQIIPVDEETPGRRTRLSCGEKPRINFAELENSDIEDIEMEEAEDEIEQVEFSTASRRKTFIDYDNFAESSDNQSSVVERSANQPLFYEESSGEGNSGVTSGSNDQLFAAFNTSSEQVNMGGSGACDEYKCSLCGLEFNQEYRWHYHMIKVHSISADRIKLFR